LIKRRYKTAGQWYDIPKLFAKSETLATEATSSTEHELVWKQRQKYTFAGIYASKSADTLVSLKLEGKKSLMRRLCITRPCGNRRITLMMGWVRSSRS
jgi:hypothetical protein